MRYHMTMPARQNDSRLGSANLAAPSVPPKSWRAEVALGAVPSRTESGMRGFWSAVRKTDWGKP